MWNLVVRLGTVLSTVMIGRELIDHFWPAEIRPARVYRPAQIAHYLGIDRDQVLALIEAGALPARWLGGSPVVLGANLLRYLAEEAGAGPWEP